MLDAVADGIDGKEAALQSAASEAGLAAPLESKESPPPADAPPPRPSALKRLAANPYASTCAILLLLASPLPVAKLTIDATLATLRGVPSFLRDRETRRKGVCWRPGGLGMMPSWQERRRALPGLLDDQPATGSQFLVGWVVVNGCWMTAI